MIVPVSETSFTSFTRCLLSFRKWVNHCQMGSGPDRVRPIQDEIEGQDDCIIYRTDGSEGKLQGVQQGPPDGLDVGQNKALKCLHDYRRQCRRSKVSKSSDS